MSAVAIRQKPRPSVAPPQAIGPHPWKCTREQFTKLVEAGFFTEKRYELIRGEIIDMGLEGPQHYTMMLVLMEGDRGSIRTGFLHSPGRPAPPRR